MRGIERARYNAVSMTTPSLRRRVRVGLTRLRTRALKALGVRDRVLIRRRRRERARRRQAEAAGLDHLSRPALHDLDRKLDATIDRDGGFFVEAGANDGFTQSNTYWLERFRGWRGILVEAIPAYVSECLAERPDAIVVHAALVAPDYPHDTVPMQFGDLLSTVQGAHGDATDEQDWVRPGLVLGWQDPYETEAPARTLSSILDEHRAPEVDLLSLDVEGYEPQALSGLDLDRHAPRWIVVEAHDVEGGRIAIEAILGERYELEAQLSPLDLLYRRRDVSSARR
jgi:FkbM family methyltransferase